MRRSTSQADGGIAEAIAALRAGDEIIRVQGVLSGAATRVLARMEHENLDLDQAVALVARDIVPATGAAALHDDVEGGRRAARKLAALSLLAWDLPLADADIDVLGLAGLTREDVRRETARGDRYRLVATATRGCASVELRRVRPDHPLHAVEDDGDVVVVHTRRSGAVVLSGGDVVAPDPADLSSGPRPLRACA